ncbi:MAG: FxLYD domain-containing protein, partial [Longimicrobiales bacterium]|nr:FxLYD domain-containing protein [Longimicrobiales bacterium]
AGFLAQGGDAEAAEALYDEISQREDLTSAEYFQIGIGFFNTGDYARAAEAFQQAAEQNPYSRDALLNLVQSLYSQAVEIEELEPSAERDQELAEIYDDLLAAAEQVRAYDPLNRNLLSFMLRSLRGQADIADEQEAQELTRRTQELYRTYQQQPYEVTSISVTARGDSQTMISGQLRNLTGNPGDEVQLQFSLVDVDGNVLGSSTVTVNAPEQNAAAQFQTTLDVGADQFAGWMYEVIN